MLRMIIILSISLSLFFFSLFFSLFVYPKNLDHQLKIFKLNDPDLSKLVPVADDNLLASLNLRLALLQSWIDQLFDEHICRGRAELWLSEKLSMNAVTYGGLDAPRIVLAWDLLLGLIQAGKDEEADNPMRVTTERIKGILGHEMGHIHNRDYIMSAISSFFHKTARMGDVPGAGVPFRHTNHSPPAGNQAYSFFSFSHNRPSLLCCALHVRLCRSPPRIPRRRIRGGDNRKR